MGPPFVEKDAVYKLNCLSLEKEIVQILFIWHSFQAIEFWTLSVRGKHKIKIKLFKGLLVNNPQ